MPAKEHEGRLNLKIKLELAHDVMLQRDHSRLAVGVPSVLLVQKHDHLVKRRRKWLVEFGGKQQTNRAKLHQVEARTRQLVELAAR